MLALAHTGITLGTTALIAGAGVTIVAFVKNVFKYAWNVDLDLTQIKK